MMSATLNPSLEQEAYDAGAACFLKKDINFMRVQEIRKKTEDDLMKLIGEMRGQVRDFRFKIANRELKNHQQLKQVKKNIARILTVLKEKGVKS